MEFTKIRCLESFFALLRRGISNVIEYNEYHQDFPLTESQIQQYMTKWVVFCVMWGVGGSMNLKTRTEFSNEMRAWCPVDLPVCGDNESIIDYEVRVEDQTWYTWRQKVPRVTIEPSKVIDASTVINTVDTARH